jgi:hypothetical protein
MVDSITDRHVVLIFGDPGSGKSHLAATLHARFGYEVIGLDDVYVAFVKTEYPELYLPAIRRFVAQHYQTLLLRHDGGRAVKAWQGHVASLVAARAAECPLVAVEGFLLLPVLDAVQASLADRAAVSIVGVMARRYFRATDVDTIHRAGNGARGEGSSPSSKR